jgi:hypothetical protein
MEYQRGAEKGIDDDCVRILTVLALDWWRGWGSQTVANPLDVVEHSERCSFDEIHLLAGSERFSD